MSVRNAQARNNAQEQRDTGDLSHYYTIRETAAGLNLYGISEHAIRVMVREGTLPTRVIHVGKKVLINYDLLLENLNKMD